MKIKVESGIAIPPVGASKFIYPFSNMEVLDSFQVPIEKYQSVQSSAYGYGRRHGKKFIARKDGKVCRVWRVE